MKNATLFNYLTSFSLIVVAIIFLFVISCGIDNNDNIAEDKNLTSRNAIQENFPFNANNIYVENGILVFPNSIIYDSILNVLDYFNHDSIFEIIYLNEIGLDLSNPLNYDYPFNPAYEKFIKKYNFESFGSIEERRLKDFLLDGNSPEDFQRHFLFGNESYLFNSRLEIKIGDKI